MVDLVLTTGHLFNDDIQNFLEAQPAVLIQNLLEAAGFHLFAASGADCGVGSREFGRELCRCVEKTTMQRGEEWLQGRMMTKLGIMCLIPC